MSQVRREVHTTFCVSIRDLRRDASSFAALYISYIATRVGRKSEECELVPHYEPRHVTVMCTVTLATQDPEISLSLPRALLNISWWFQLYSVRISLLSEEIAYDISALVADAGYLRKNVASHTIRPPSDSESWSLQSQPTLAFFFQVECNVPRTPPRTSCMYSSSS